MIFEVWSAEENKACPTSVPRGTPSWPRSVRSASPSTRRVRKCGAFTYPEIMYSFRFQVLYIAIKARRQSFADSNASPTRILSNLPTMSTSDLDTTRRAIAKVSSGKNVNEDSWMTYVTFRSNPPLGHRFFTIVIYCSSQQDVVQHELGRLAATSAPLYRTVGLHHDHCI